MCHIIKSYISEQLNGCFKALIPNMLYKSGLLLLLNHNLFNSTSVTSFCYLLMPGQLAQTSSLWWAVQARCWLFGWCFCSTSLNDSPVPMTSHPGSYQQVPVSLANLAAAKMRWARQEQSLREFLQTMQVGESPSCTHWELPSITCPYLHKREWAKSWVRIFHCLKWLWRTGLVRYLLGSYTWQ